MIDHLFLGPNIGKRCDFNNITNNKMIFTRDELFTLVLGLKPCGRVMIPWDFVLLRHGMIFSDLSFKNRSFSLSVFLHLILLT